MGYFVKQDDKLYKFARFNDLENFTGKCRKLHDKDFARAVRRAFPKGELSAFYGAKFKGWINNDGQPVNMSKGNSW